MKWIKKIWNRFVRWFKGLFRKKYKTVKPSGSVSLSLNSLTGIEPTHEYLYHRRSAMIEQINLMGRRNTDQIMSMIEAMYSDPLDEPIPEKRPFIKKK